VEYPLTIALNEDDLLAMQIGHPDILKAVEVRLATLKEEADLALAQVNDLLNDGYTMIFRERVKDIQSESLHLFFYRPPLPAETVEQTAIKEAIRLYNNPPAMDGAGEHPDTIRLRLVMETLFKTGLYPDATNDDTQKLVAVNIGEVGW